VAFVSYSNQQAAETLAAELKWTVAKSAPVQADVRDFSRPISRRSTVRGVGKIDVLVGLGRDRPRRLWAHDARTMADVLETNLGGTFNYCHAVTQPMMMMRRGSIVNLSSTAAEFAARGQVNYAASKGGINGLTRSLAKELAPRNVRVNAVAPGMIETDMSQVVRGSGDQSKIFRSSHRLAQEIAAVAAFWPSRRRT
jgi:3-oxoacyl-[acyl-carrier protein] reductase